MRLWPTDRPEEVEKYNVLHHEPRRDGADYLAAARVRTGELRARAIWDKIPPPRGTGARPPNADRPSDPSGRRSVGQ